MDIIVIELDVPDSSKSAKDNQSESELNTNDDQVDENTKSNLVKSSCNVATNDVSINNNNKMTTSKNIPLILKRNRPGSEKSDFSESNENIDENQKEIELKTDKPREMTQRSSSRKVSDGSDFLDLDDKYSNSRYANKKTRTKNCSYCSKSDGEIHHCKFCRSRGHIECFESNLGVTREGYKNEVVICKQCRTNCEICDKAFRYGELYFCSRCSSVFHKSCDPNLSRQTRIVFGQWQCSFCDTLDSLVGDSLTEDQCKKEINRRKLLAMRKRLRKSDYILEDSSGVRSIQQVVKQAVKKRKIDVKQTDDDETAKIELSDDELDTSKHILSETKQLDIWSQDESIDFVRLEEELRRERKSHNILIKHIKEDKTYYLFVKDFVDHLKDSDFDCKKNNFIKVLHSDSFKRSFFEHNSQNGLTKGSVFLEGEGLTKWMEKCLLNEYWEENSINQKDYFLDDEEKQNDLEKPIINGNEFDVDHSTQCEIPEKSTNQDEISKEIEKTDHVDSNKSNCKVDSDFDDDYDEEFEDDKDKLEQYRIHLENESSTSSDEQQQMDIDILNGQSDKMDKKEIAIEEKPVEVVSTGCCETLETEISSHQQVSPEVAQKTDSEHNDIIAIKQKENEFDQSDQKETEAISQPDLVETDLRKENLIDESNKNEEFCELMCEEQISERTSFEEKLEDNKPNDIQETIYDSKDVDIEMSEPNKTIIQSSICEEISQSISTDKTTDSTDNIINEETKVDSNDQSNNYDSTNCEDTETTAKQVQDSEKVESTGNRSNDSSTSGSRPVSRSSSHKEHRLKKKKTNKPSISKQSKSDKQKVKIKSSNNLVDKLFKRACKYYLNLLERHREKVLESLSTFSDLCLNGKVPLYITYFLYGATLCGLNKKDNSIRPIAIGNTLRRLVARIASSRISERMGDELRPKQLGYGTRGGCEAGVHAARHFVNFGHDSIKVLMKVDFRNAYNEIERHPMLQSTKEKCPEIFPFMRQCYAQPSWLSFGDFGILSQRGCQQGDPCGPAIFCLGINDMVLALASEFNIWFMDDGTIGGSPDTVFNYLETIINKSGELGLQLNFEKCEIKILGNYSQDDRARILERFNEIAPGIVDRPEDIELLGSPLTIMGIRSAIHRKLEKLKTMVGRMDKLNSHHSYCLLRSSLSIPQLNYLLRTTPCWQALDVLEEYDRILRSTMENIANCRFSDGSWNEATLPVKLGGLGLRNATNLCFSSFLGSIHSVADLVSTIVSSFSLATDGPTSEALEAWSTISQSDILPETERKFQHKWDVELCSKQQRRLFEDSANDVSKARILANNTKESGAWLNTFPFSTLGTLLDNQSFRIAVALRLGLPLCVAHTCVCGVEVDEFGLHGLVCNKSAGRYARHAIVNDLIKRALMTCKVPSILEPTGCNRSDGKKPDGLTLVPWKNGKHMVWDFTCADTLAKSYVKGNARKPGFAAQKRESYKRTLYKDIETNYLVIPVCVETLGTFGEDGLKLIKRIGELMQNVTGEKRSTSFLIQRISVAVQKGNAASILGTVPSDSSLEEIYYL